MFAIQHPTEAFSRSSLIDGRYEHPQCFAHELSYYFEIGDLGMRMRARRILVEYSTHGFAIFTSS